MKTTINLNEEVKFKLTDFAKDIYYHRYDEVNKNVIQKGGKPIEPQMPKTDKDGYTTMQLWDFMNLYGEYMLPGKQEILKPLEIIYETRDK